MLNKYARISLMSLGSAVILSAAVSASQADTDKFDLNRTIQSLDLSSIDEQDLIELAQVEETAAEKAARKREERRAERARKRAERAAKRKQRSSRPRFGSFN